MIVLTYRQDYDSSLLIGVFQDKEAADLIIEHLIHTENKKQLRFFQHEVELGQIVDIDI